MFLIYPLSHLLKNLSITFAKENDLQELKKIFLFLFKRNDINHKPHFNNAKFIILSQFDDDQKKIINSQIDLIKNDFIQNLKKVTSSMRSIPNIEQGIYFTKRLYFSVGGIGKFGTSPFNEISKRFYSRIDPQNPLPALIIRTKNLDIFQK